MIPFDLFTCIKRFFRHLILFVFLVSISLSVVYGQLRKEEPPPLKERLFYGGSFGLQFGTLTDIQLSPVIGLWVLPRMALAVGPNYRYFKFYDEKTNIYGGKGYMQYVVVQDLGNVVPLLGNIGIFFHLEDEILSLESEYWKTASVSSERFYINTILAGGGVSQKMGRRSSVSFIFLWALNDSVYEVYGNPEIRVSFIF
jgi:hypothetical protein